MFNIKKNTVTLIITAVILVAMTVATVVLTGIQNGENASSGSASSQTSSTERHKFFEFTKDDLKTVTLTNEHGSFTLEKIKEEKNSYLVLKGNEEEKINLSLSSAIFNYIASASSTKLVVSDASDLSVYGLDKPSVTLKGVLENGEEHSFYIGSKAPDGSYYVNSSDSADVYVITAYSAEDLMVSRLSLYPIDIFGTMTSETFNGMKLIRPKSHNIEIIKLSAEEYEEATNNAEASIKTQLELKTPFKFDVNAVYVDNFIKAISGLTGTVVSDDVSSENLKKYGLDNPMKLTFTADNVTVLIGNKNTFDNVYYIMREGRNVIYTVSADALYFVEDGANKYAYSMIGLVALKNVSSLVIEGNGKTYDFKCGDDFENLEVFHGTTELPPEEFKKLYQQIFSVTQNGLADGSHQKELYARITYNKKNGTKLEIEYYKIDSSRTYAVVNGEGIFTVRTDMLDKVLADCERLLNGEIITVV